MRKTFSFLFLFFMGMSIAGCQNMIGSLSSTVNPTSGGGSNDSVATMRLSDRYYVGSVFTNIFVPSSVLSGEDSSKASIQTKIQTLVTNQYADFGGPCDRFLSSDASQDCGILNTQVASYGSNTSLRAALSLRTLYWILDDTDSKQVALKSAIAQTKGISYSSVNLTGLSAPTSTDLQNLFKLVYPGMTPSADTLEKSLTFTNQVNSSHGATEAWRYAVILMMSTMIWQMP